MTEREAKVRGKRRAGRVDAPERLVDLDDLVEPDEADGGPGSAAAVAAAAEDDKLTKRERAARAMLRWPPSARDLRAWMDVKDLSNKDVAKALKLADGRAVRFWTAKKSPRTIPYPSWYTLKHKFGD